MNTNELEMRVRGVIERMNPDSVDGIEPDTDLFDAGILDSFGMISFLVELESEFSISIANEDLIPQNLWNIEATSRTIGRYVGK